MVRLRPLFLMAAVAAIVFTVVRPGMRLQAQQATRSIDIHSKQFAFEPAEITLKKGETVKLVLYSDDVPHSLAVEGLPIHAGMEKGHPAEVVVTPSETGDFKGRCSKFCGSGHRDMHFVVHVVE